MSAGSSLPEADAAEVMQHLPTYQEEKEEEEEEERAGGGGEGGGKGGDLKKS